MGMYDTVNVDILCPACGEHTIAQSKDGDCVLALVDPTELKWFKLYCNECGTRHLFIREGVTVPKARATPYTLEEVLSLGFEIK
jgi:predicted RNA-binding Zn-ribbon protein involved in translation (DUF1610 family)